MNTHYRPLVSLLFSAGLTFACAAAPAAPAAEATVKTATAIDAADAVHCLRTADIRNFDILDNRNILLQMNDRSMFLSVLSQPCPGLSPNQPILYRTSIGQLCDLDIVTVLDNTGFGFTPGASCGLGVFTPMDEETVRQLKRKRANQS